MRRLLAVACILSTPVMLSACSGTPAVSPVASVAPSTSATAANSPSASVTALASAPTADPTQAVAAIKSYASGLNAQQADAAFLKAIRATITTGTDADVQAAGHQVCDFRDSGLKDGPLMTKVEALGYTPSQSMSLVMTAGLLYCPTKQ